MKPWNGLYKIASRVTPMEEDDKNVIIDGMRKWEAKISNHTEEDLKEMNKIERVIAVFWAKHGQNWLLRLGLAVAWPFVDKAAWDYFNGETMEDENEI